MAARAPGPLHCIARVNRHRCRPEAEAVVAHRHRDRSAACHGGAHSQKGSNNRHQQRQAAFKSSYCIAHSAQLQTIGCPQAILGE